jgi:predicted O-methyltransferase YrrM
MYKQTLTRLAKQAALAGPMVAHYPDPSNPKVTFPPSPYYRFLKLIAKETRALVSVELGVCGGGGSLHLAMGSVAAVGVDVVADHPDNTDWIKFHYPNWYFLVGDSVEISTFIYESFGKIDVLFIDTTHTYEQTMAEYLAYYPYLSDRAIVCLDDLFRPGMDRAWNEMPETKVRFDFLHPSQSPTDGGFGVVWK